MIEADVKWIGKKIKPGDIILVEKVEKDKKIISDFTIKQIPHVQGAIIVIEVETGRILAMQGGYSFSMSEFNRSTSYASMWFCF